MVTEYFVFCALIVGVALLACLPAFGLWLLGLHWIAALVLAAVSIVASLLYIAFRAEEAWSWF